jgi:hypothetical protein
VNINNVATQKDKPPKNKLIACKGFHQSAASSKLKASGFEAEKQTIYCQTSQFLSAMPRIGREN